MTVVADLALAVLAFLAVIGGVVALALVLGRSWHEPPPRGGALAPRPAQEHPCRSTPPDHSR